MSDIKLFRLATGKATELQGSASDLEKQLQTLIEANLVPLQNIRFVASEHSTGKTRQTPLTGVTRAWCALQRTLPSTTAMRCSRLAATLS